MSSPFQASVGFVMSADIAVPDYEQVKQFYIKVLTTGNAPLWRDDLMNNLGIPIIGLGRQTPDYANLPIAWMPHIQVTNVATSVTEAIANGGSELMHGRDGDGNSQWAVLTDPNGTAFGVIPVVSKDDLPKTEESAKQKPFGYIGWLDLTVKNATEIRDFYKAVIGWSSENVPMSDGNEQYADFNMTKDDGQPGAGICHSRGTNAHMPPVWMIYLPVGDLALSLEHVQSGGGRIVKEYKNDDGQTTFAAIQDPVGAYLALMQAG